MATANSASVNSMRTPVSDSKTPPQSEQGYQRSIAQPSAAADNNTPKKATTAKGRRRRRRYSRAMRKSRTRGRRGTRRR
jgi:hypothetical protein